MRVAIVFWLSSAAVLACGSSSSTPDGGTDAGNSADTGADATLDSGGGGDASDGGITCPGTQVLCNGACCATGQACVQNACQDVTYNDVTQSSSWVSYDLTGADSNTQGYAGGTFDGRYVYYASRTSVLLRYDTQSNAFTAKGSWETFDASPVDTNAGYYQGAVFDGHYVYFIGSDGPKVLRYDTTKPFKQQTSYDAFDTKTVDSTNHGFAGATFDGKYIYFTPWYVPGSYQSVAFQYDTTASFTATGSWKSYDLSNVDSTAEGYFGCVFDGKSVSFVPLRHGSNQAEGLVIRYDTTGASFTTDGSWSVFDTKNVDPSAAGYAGGAFDGKNVYFVPLMGYASRYDTTGTFDGGGAWKAYSTANVDPDVASMEYGGFDGKYVYFGTSNKTKIARVDTTLAFDQKASWGVFDLSTLTPASGTVAGMIFDGRYMYFPPTGLNKVTARFDTKSGSVMPALPQFHGSFF